MPCTDSSSGLNLHLDHHDCLLGFEFAKITCSSEIGGGKALSIFCKGKALEEILDFDFWMLVSVLDLNEDQEGQFILYMELDALKAAIVQYLGIIHEAVDNDRCRISSIDYGVDTIDVAFVILPPKELPKILPCRLANKGED